MEAVCAEKGKGMEVFRGKGVCSGIAMGKLFVLSKKNPVFEEQQVTDIDAELERYESAKERAAEELSDLQGRALAGVGEAQAAIFEAHRMILLDPGFTDSVKQEIVNRRRSAACAVGEVADRLLRRFSGMEDAVLRARSADIQDVAERLLCILTDRQKGRIETEEPVIVAAQDLTPSETVQFPTGQVLAFVTVLGSENSHTAILARTRKLPALVETAFPLTEELNGREAIVDGEAGCLYLDPDEETRKQYLLLQEQEKEREKALLKLKGKADVTADGHPLHLYANIGSLDELALAMENDAAGIGLFRSEFLYMERQSFPSEEEQFQAYSAAAQAMAGRRVVIRTLDIGADKQADFFRCEPEENPALGFRAIRICLSYPEMFKTQLRAILRAGACGNVAVMYPMITSLRELSRIRELLREAEQELAEQGIPFAKVEEGIMIETPAAVMISDALAAEVDFFSIGTNDLTQYTLAVDRQDPRLSEFCEAHHPAVLKMIRMTVENAHKAGIKVGICGELGADLSLTEQFVRMGVDELSVAPGRILPIRKHLREIRIDRESGQTAEAEQDS